MVATASQPVVRLAGVTKRYGDAPPVLSRVNLSVDKGEFVSFVGPSGCGKSTLLRLIAGLIEPTNGTIQINGQPPREARGEMGFVFQDPTLLPWRTAAANVELPLELGGSPRAERGKRARELLGLMGLAQSADRYPWQLSGGMRMRVSIARALAHSPRLLLLDEPFAALDAMTRDRLNEDLLVWRERDPFTAFFVTHSIAEALFLANRIVILSDQKVALVIESPFSYPRSAELRESPEFLRVLAEATRAMRETTPGGATA